MLQKLACKGFTSTAQQPLHHHILKKNQRLRARKLFKNWVDSLKQKKTSSKMNEVYLNN
jgi:hypothetical protein